MPSPAGPSPARPGLAVFRDPASVAVVGASDDPAKWGHWLARGALKGRARRTVHFVNRTGGRVLGERTATSLAELGNPVELVAVAVPAPRVAGVVGEALAQGARGLLVITDGVSGVGELAARVSGAGARLLGPTSLGLYDAPGDLHLAWGEFRPGPLAVVSQSGQVGTEVAQLAARAGIGVSRFVSLGKQVDVTAADVLHDLISHDETRVVALYLEEFSAGRDVFDAVRALREAGKPVCLLTAGTSAAGGRATRSHTGAVSSPLELVDAACRAAGATRVETPARLVDLVSYLLTAEPPRSRHIAIVSDSGGQGALAADVAANHRLHLPLLSPATRTELARLVPGGEANTNPVDLAGAGERDLRAYPAVVSELLALDEIDAVVMSGYFGRYGMDSPSLQRQEDEVAGELGRARARAGKPVVVHTMGADSITAVVLRDAGLPVYPTIDAAMGALAAAAGLAQRSPAVAGASERVRVPAEMDYWAARTFLAGAGMPFPAGSPVRTSADLLAAAGILTAPYVLKASWPAHKTEAGAVRVGLADRSALEGAFAEMSRRLGPGRYVVEEQDTRAGVVEMLVGARQDPWFGPVITVGAGGTEAELYRDVRTECAPVDLTRAMAMIRSLRCVALLDGWRGKPAVDILSLAQAVVAVSQIIVRGGISELEVNPVRVGPSGVLAVDALVTGEDHERAE